MSDTDKITSIVLTVYDDINSRNDCKIEPPIELSQEEIEKCYNNPEYLKEKYLNGSLPMWQEMCIKTDIEYAMHPERYRVDVYEGIEFVTRVAKC